MKCLLSCKLLIKMYKINLPLQKNVNYFKVVMTIKSTCDIWYIDFTDLAMLFSDGIVKLHVQLL